MIVIIGESGAGKSTLQKALTDNLSNKFKKLVTYTTRPPRGVEQDGVDYHFVDNKTFNTLKNGGFFLETAMYRGWQYGSPKDVEPESVAVLTPAGLRAARRKGIDTIAFYIKVDRRARLINLLKRGDDIEEAYRRSLSDIGQFDGVEDEVDFTIDNNEYSYDVFVLMDIVLQKIAETRNNN